MNPGEIKPFAQIEIILHIPKPDKQTEQENVLLIQKKTLHVGVKLEEDQAEILSNTMVKTNEADKRQKLEILFSAFSQNKKESPEPNELGIPEYISLANSKDFEQRFLSQILEKIGIDNIPKSPMGDFWLLSIRKALSQIQEKISLELQSRHF